MRKYRNDLTAGYIKGILEYNTETGDFYWREKLNKNTILGTIAGNIDPTGYIRIRINKKAYGAHRLAHLWMTGEWPDADMDHINGIRNDNRWRNLREATVQQNNRYAKPSSKSGYKGVSYHKTKNKWEARIHYGLYDTKEEAALAYNEAAKLLFGEFAYQNKV